MRFQPKIFANETAYYQAIYGHFVYLNKKVLAAKNGLNYSFNFKQYSIS